jgi:hypothetical protein
MVDGPMLARRPLLRRAVCGTTALLLLAGDLSALAGRAGANPEVQPANPCAMQQQKKKKEDPGVPPAVGRDRIERLLRDRRQDDQMPQQDPNMPMQPPQERAPSDDGGIGRIGEHLRRQPGVAVPPSIAGVLPKPDPG